MLSAWRGALLLLVALWSWGAVPAAGGQPTGLQVCKSECPKFTTPIPLDRLRSYERTKCGKSGVLLTTKKNKIICANPEDKWVQDVMRELDAMNAPSVTEGPGHFDNLFGNVAYPTKTFSTAAYETSTFSGLSAVSSTLAGPQALKPSTGSTSKPEIIVSITTLPPEPLANRSTSSFFTDGPKTFGKGLEDIRGSMSDLVEPPTSPGTQATEAVADGDRKVSSVQSTLHSSSTIINLLKKNSTSNDRLLPSSDQQGSAILGFSTVPQRVDFTSPPGKHVGTNESQANSVKIKSDIVSIPGETTGAPLSTQANRVAFSRSSGTTSGSGLQEDHFMEKSSGEATTLSPEVSSPFLPKAWARHQNHIIIVVFLGFVFCIYLAITGMCAKSHVCTQASPMQMVRGLAYTKIDPQASAYAMQVL